MAGRLIFALATAVAMMLAQLAPASMLPLKLEELVAVSDAIVTVRVTRTEQGFIGRHLYTTAHLEVLDTIKGKVEPGPLSISYLGGRHQIIHVHVPQTPKLQEQEEVTLFLSQPVKRLPKSVTDRLNMNSPLVQSYQIVGGQLGRFSLLSKDGRPNKTRKGSEAIPSDLLATRAVMKRTADGKSAIAPTYGDFRAAVAQLVEAEKQKIASKGATDEIKGVYGAFAIPEKSSNPIVRLFDPLPEMAYMSPEEFEALNSKVQEQQKALLQEGAEN